VLATGFPYNIRVTTDTNLREYAAFAVRCRGVRGFGSAVRRSRLDRGGRLDGFWALRPWIRGMSRRAVLFVEEAGGRVTNLVGGRQT